MRFRILSCLVLLGICLDAAAGDLYAVFNRLRAGEGQCVGAERLPALKPQAALERVARDLSRGNKLQPSLKAAGYRATRTRVLSIKGVAVGERAAEISASQY